MTAEQQEALNAFFEAVTALRNANIIRSDKYLGDIAEFLCQEWYGIELAEAGNQPGFDGEVDGELVQIKYSGGSSTTVDCGNPEQYDILIIVLGPESVLRPAGYDHIPYLRYRITSERVMEKIPHKGGVRRYTANQLPIDCLEHDEDFGDRANE